MVLEHRGIIAKEAGALYASGTVSRRFLFADNERHDARYVVRLPRDASNWVKLGQNSNSIALRRFLAIPRKLNQQLELREDKFLKEYEELRTHIDG